VSSDSLHAARQVLQLRFGYPDFRRGQAEAIATVLAGRDVLVVLPTGGGKSLCYQVPALVLPGMTVVISPLISLMHDQVQALERRGVAAAYLDSTIPRGELQARLMRAMRGELRLLYVAPERLMMGDLTRRLRSAEVSLLAIDEAHCISEWGHDFRPSYLRLAEARAALGARRTIALTATATPAVRRDIVRQVRLKEPRVIVTGFDRPNLTFRVHRAGTDRLKSAALLGIMRRSHGAAVVYASTRGAVERLAGFLSRNGILAAAYHAGRDDPVRARAQSAFMADRVRAIVATNAFGMGVDKPDVRTVVHYAMPGTLEAYYQEAGRGGRDGQPSVAILLHAYADRFTHEFFIAASTPPWELVARVHALLRSAPDGLDSRTLAARIPRGNGSAGLEGALRLLRGAGLLGEDSPGERAFVRLVATPKRIVEELGRAESFELGVLRTLWRAHGERLALGLTVDLSQLPPGFGGTQNVAPVLDALQSRQLVVWSSAGGRLKLADRETPLEKAVPRKSLERHRQHSLAKLRAMEQYAFAKTCRRAELLRYFGERPRSGSCRACDNCADLEPIAVR
jgi:ATP-dependent DNA helicase RecQ